MWLSLDFKTEVKKAEIHNVNKFLGIPKDYDIEVGYPTACILPMQCYRQCFQNSSYLTYILAAAEQVTGMNRLDLMLLELILHHNRNTGGSLYRLMLLNT